MAQGSLCSEIEPFCAGSERLTFPNSNNTNSTQVNAEFGPNYDCLINQPYPSWFFLQVEDSGELRFRISQFENEDGSGASLDVDFIVWGPFEKGEEYCSGSQLNLQNRVDCSYSEDGIEFMTIPNAVANEIYVVLITNFQTMPGYISLEQINSSGGSTDCSILDGDLGGDVSVCDEESYTFDGTTAEADIYEWYVFNDTTSQYEQIVDENEPTLTVTADGDYRLIVRNSIDGNEDQEDVSIRFYNSPLIGEVDEISGCGNVAETIDLTVASDLLLSANSNIQQLRVRYYENSDDAENDDPIPNPANYGFEPGSVVFARVVDVVSGCMSAPESINMVSFDFPDLGLDEYTLICVDETGNIIASETLGEDLGEGYEYVWKSGGDTLSANPVIVLYDMPLSNELTLTITNKEYLCEREYTTVLVPVSKPSNVSFEISGTDFGEGYSVTVTAEGFIGGDLAGLEYRLDSGSWQESQVFRKVRPGNHTVSARVANGCGEATSESFFLVGYPRFFTPNSDGYNDTWRLLSNQEISIKKLYIFDRYGKLLKQMDPSGNKGWDGTYNGMDLPADDYWFKIEYIDNRTGNYQVYSANFTLKR